MAWVLTLFLSSQLQGVILKISTVEQLVKRKTVIPIDCDLAFQEIFSDYVAYTAYLSILVPLTHVDESTAADTSNLHLGLNHTVPSTSWENKKTKNKSKTLDFILSLCQQLNLNYTQQARQYKPTSLSIGFAFMEISS